jgi:hypothetical protein
MTFSWLTLGVLLSTQAPVVPTTRERLMCELTETEDFSRVITTSLGNLLEGKKEVSVKNKFFRGVCTASAKKGETPSPIVLSCTEKKSELAFEVLGDFYEKNRVSSAVLHIKNKVKNKEQGVLINLSCTHLEEVEREVEKR